MSPFIVAARDSCSRAPAPDAALFAWAHPYPPHHPNLPYAGKHHYFPTFCTDQRRTVFTQAEPVDLVWAQFLRGATEQSFSIPAYCFMPDHAHLIVQGLTDASDVKAFITGAKQYSGYHFNHRFRHRLWQRYGYERVIRDGAELAFTIGDIVSNPVRSGLVAHPSEHPYLGSQCYPVAELLQIREYFANTRMGGEARASFRLKAEATRVDGKAEAYKS